jgi:hypothetical protein
VELLSLLEPALAPGLVDSREEPPAEAPETSEPELRELPAELPVELLGDVLDESLGAPADELLLLLGPALPAEGELWAKAPEAAPAAARAAAAQSVVIVRI